MRWRWPRFWVDRFKGFNYGLVCSGLLFDDDDLAKMGNRHGKKEEIWYSHVSKMQALDGGLCLWRDLGFSQTHIVFASLIYAMGSLQADENPQIFVINMVIPMLGTVYWEGTLPIRYQLAMNVSTLLGSMLGQVVFGILADIYGRRKVYGLELIVTVVASLGFAASSPGVNNSMSMIAWLIFWRMLMGVSIGMRRLLRSVIDARHLMLMPFA